MFSVLRKTKVIFKKLFFFFFESREAAKNSKQRYASSQRNRRKMGSNQLESQEKGNVKEYSRRQAFNLTTLIIYYSAVKKQILTKKSALRAEVRT